MYTTIFFFTVIYIYNKTKCNIILHYFTTTQLKKTTLTLLPATAWEKHILDIIYYIFCLKHYRDIIATGKLPQGLLT